MRIFALIFILAGGLAAPLAAQDINLGTNDGEWANDVECDDRCFFGAGMASTMTWEYVGLDAEDCATLFDVGVIKVWDMTS